MWTFPKNEPWLALDVESTGLDEAAEAVEIAVVEVGGSTVFETRVRPAGPVSLGAERLHGLSAARLAREPRFCAIYDHLEKVLRGRVVVAYNASFDRRVLETSARLAGLPPLPVRWTCALDLYESLRHFRPSLHVACEIEGVPPPSPPHRAASDARALRVLMLRLLEVAGSKKLFDN